MPTALTGLPTSWREGTSPSGERMVYVRTQDLTRDNIPAKYQAIRAWADANGWTLKPLGYDLIQYNAMADFYFWTGFGLDDSGITTGGNDALFEPYACPGCQREIEAGIAICPDCVNINACYRCNVFGLTLYVETGGDGKGYCYRCTADCQTCDGRIPQGSNFVNCATCDERIACRGCSAVFSMAATTERGGHRYCPTCITNFCESCETYDANRAAIELDGTTQHLCQPCAQKIYDEQREKMEVWDSEQMPVSGTLLIPSSEIRPIRTISIETEFDGKGPEVTRALHKAGLLPAPDMDQSHTAQPRGITHPCLMKRDGTVTGGELVTYLLDLDNENHAEALLRMTEVMKGCRDMQFAQFTHRAGGHIHIDLHGFTMRDAWAYYTLFQYLQKPLYYIGGAGSAFGHRTLEGSGYSSPPPGGPFGSLRKFALEFPKDRFGLNLGNWSQSRNHCKCGAFAAGEWSECNCNLGKATAEWRLWNAEISPRILHAWIALMQAITAYAQIISADMNEAEYPYLLWKNNRFKDESTAARKQIKERLEWMHGTLPLTIHERDSLIYALKQSDLKGLGESYLNGLLDIPNTSMGKKAKLAPNPASRRKTNFKLKKLTASKELSTAEIEALVAQGWAISGSPS